MSSIDIIKEYTSGKKTLEETNAALNGSGIQLDPQRNTITEAELRATTVGHYPDMANGWGLLDSGTGTMDKVEVRGGKLVNVNMGSSYALVIIAGRVYEVAGDKLTDAGPAKPKEKKLPNTPDMRRIDLAGQVVEQKTGTGPFLVTYDEDGYAVKASRKR